MIITDVYFKDMDIVHATARSVQSARGAVRLSHAGGKVGDYAIEVSDAPTLLEGHRYLIFLSDDSVRRENI
jgi:hypothetical protein